MKIVKKERDPPLFTSKQLIKFQKILRNTTQVIVWHRICLQTDGQTWWNQHTPLQLRCGGYNKSVFIHYIPSNYKQVSTHTLYTIKLQTSQYTYIIYHQITNKSVLIHYIPSNYQFFFVIITKVSHSHLKLCYHQQQDLKLQENWHVLIVTLKNHEKNTDNI